MNNKDKKLKEPDTLSGEIVDRLSELEEKVDIAWKMTLHIVAFLLNKAGALDDVIAHFEEEAEKGNKS